MNGIIDLPRLALWVLASAALVLTTSSGLADLPTGALYISSYNNVYRLDDSGSTSLYDNNQAGCGGYRGVAADAAGNWYATCDLDGGSALLANGSVVFDTNLDPAFPEREDLEDVEVAHDGTVYFISNRVQAPSVVYRLAEGNVVVVIDDDVSPCEPGDDLHGLKAVAGDAAGNWYAAANCVESGSFYSRVLFNGATVFTLTSTSPMSGLDVAPDGSIYLTTEDALYRSIDGAANFALIAPLASNFFSSGVAVDAEGNVYVAQPIGVVSGGEVVFPAVEILQDVHWVDSECGSAGIGGEITLPATLLEGFDRECKSTTYQTGVCLTATDPPPLGLNPDTACLTGRTPPDENGLRFEEWCGEHTVAICDGCYGLYARRPDGDTLVGKCHFNNGRNIFTFTGIVDPNDTQSVCAYTESDWKNYETCELTPSQPGCENTLNDINERFTYHFDAIQNQTIKNHQFGLNCSLNPPSIIPECTSWQDVSSSLRVGGPFGDIYFNDLPPIVQGVVIANGAMASYANSDGDDVEDVADNCLLTVNDDQRDTDSDGFGNRCDADLNGDCVVNPVDLGLFRSEFFCSDASQECMDADFNGDGVVNLQDLGILRSLFFLPPGPTALPNDCD